MRYSKDHIWIKYNNETKKAECGISFHAQNSLGKISNLRLPRVGQEVGQNSVFGKVEGVYCELDLFSPVEFVVKDVG